MLKYIGYIWILVIALGIATGIGWALNIIKLFSIDGSMTNEFILRIIGIPIAPFGALMGYFY